MSNTSKIFLNRVTDELVIEILKTIVPVLESNGIDYFIVGAFARDLGLSSRGFDELPARKTKDIDLAVMVGSVREYEALKAEIASLPDFERDEEEPYRFIFKKAYEVDFLPFGEIHNEKGQVEVKAKKTFTLDIPGFEEVEPWAESVETVEGITLKVSSLPGVILLKLFAWEDRPNRKKDIQDIDYILKNFYLLYLEEIINADGDILELCQDEKYYDAAVSARYIGRKMSQMLAGSPALRTRLLNLLESQFEKYSMARLMDYPTLENSRQIIKAMFYGLLDEKEGG